MLAGFSMGTGEVTRYLGTHGSAGVSKAMLFGVIPPFLLQTEDNPKGVPGSVFEDIKQAIVADRYEWFDDFFANFYNTECWRRNGSASSMRASFQVAAGASPYASYACVDTWLTDFRGDLPKIDVPTLVVHGTADRILPFEATAARLRDENLIADLTVVEVENGPHNIGWTHPAETNAAILEFLGGEAKPTPRRPQPRRWRQPPSSGRGGRGRHVAAATLARQSGTLSERESEIRRRRPALAGSRANSNCMGERDSETRPIPDQTSETGFQVRTRG